MSKRTVSAAGGAMAAPRLDRSAIMTRAWELARAWHAQARSFHFNRQQERPRVALRLEAPAPFVGKLRAHFAEALRQAWAEARAAHMAGAGATKDQLEEIVADEALALIDHYRIVRGALYKGFGAASELGDGNSLALPRGGCTRISGIAGD